MVSTMDFNDYVLMTMDNDIDNSCNDCDSDNGGYYHDDMNDGDGSGDWILVRIQ